MAETTSDFDPLIALRIKGFATAEVLAGASGLEVDRVQAQLDALLADARAEPTRMGVRLTGAGKAEADRRIAAERGQADPARLQSMYGVFCTLNAAFKTLVTDWQMRSVGGQPVLNDHRDAAYDAAVLARLDALHPRLLDLIGELARLLPRLGSYARRFEAALQRLQAGEQRYLTAPLIDSYHTVWFELHQDLILACGLNRADEAAAGRAH